MQSQYPVPVEVLIGTNAIRGSSTGDTIHVPIFPQVHARGPLDAARFVFRPSTSELVLDGLRLSQNWNMSCKRAISTGGLAARLDVFVMHQLERIHGVVVEIHPNAVRNREENFHDLRIKLRSGVLPNLFSGHG